MYLFSILYLLKLQAGNDFTMYIYIIYIEGKYIKHFCKNGMFQLLPLSIYVLVVFSQFGQQLFDKLKSVENNGESQNMFE